MIAYEKEGEWSGYTIKEAETGFVIEYWSRQWGAPDGLKILVPYGTWGISRGVYLDEDHNEWYEVGEYLADMARADIDQAATKVLRHGNKVQSRRPS